MWATIGLLLALGTAQAGKKSVEIPVDVGVGPAVFNMTGPVADQQPWHTGLAISVEAVIDNKTLRKFKHRIPKQYREMVMGWDEVRLSHPLLPRTLFISPAGLMSDTGIYGIGWRPVGLDIPWIYMHSGTLDAPMHFVRPGLDGLAELEVRFSDRTSVSFGWDSMFHIPQRVGGPVFETAPLDESIWHIGQGFVKFHYRVPIQVKR